MPDLSYLPQIALSGIAVGCIYGLIGIGFCVIYNASGIVNFAQGAFVMMGGMIAYTALKFVGLPLPVAAAVAIVAVAAIGVVIERVVVRPLWDRKATMFVMILATLAAQIVVERLSLILAGDQPRTLPPFSDLPPIRLGAVVVSYQFLWIVGISLLLIVLLDQFFKRTRTGKAMRACAFNREAASLQGINVSRMLIRGARRHRRRANYADAIHRVQRWRAVCDLRLHRGHRRRIRPSARRLYGRNHVGAGAIDRHRCIRGRLEERGRAVGSASLSFYPAGGHPRRSQIRRELWTCTKSIGKTCRGNPSAKA